MMSFGGWSSVSRIVMILMLQVDRLAVALLGTISGVTYYAVPANLASRINVLGGASANLFFSRASLLHAGNEPAELRRQQDQARRFLTWATTTLAVPVAVLGPSFLRVWIGPDMALRGGPILVVLAVAYALIAISSPDSATIEASGRPDLTAKAMMAWAAVGIVEVLVFGSAFGPKAIAFAVATWLSGLALTNIAISRSLTRDRTRPTEPMPWIGLLIVIAAGVAAGSGLRTAIDSVASALLAMAAVGLLLGAIGYRAVLSTTDRQFIRTRFTSLIARRTAFSADPTAAWL